MNVEQRERKTNVMQDGKASIQQGTGAHIKLSKGIIPFISVDFKGICISTLLNKA